MPRKVTVAVVAIGGYGSGYVHTLLTPRFRRIARIVAAVDPAPEGCEDFAALRKLKVPIYASLDAFYRKAKRAPDLVVISSPIHLHAPQSILALRHGSNVLCEKPMCATVEEAEALRAARDRAGKFVAIGYQRSFAPSEKALHRDVLRGLFGRPKRMRAIVLWPRDAEYYGRNNWAGMQQSPDGRWVLDSPANNATAHYLHAMLHLLGKRRDASANPAEVTAELYRANDITNFDTAALRIVTTEGVEVFFVTSHAVEQTFGPAWRYEFEKAVVEPDGSGGAIARFRNGRVKRYPWPRGKDYVVKLDEAIRLARKMGTVPPRQQSRGQSPFSPTCGIEAALAQTVCVNAARKSARIVSLKKLRRAKGEGAKRVWYVPGLADVLTECWRRRKLPSELGVSWARPGRRVAIKELP